MSIEKMSIEKAIKAFKAIETEKDLKRAKLTLAEFNEIYEDLREYIKSGQTRTICKAVAEWFTKQGFMVEVEDVGWKVL